MKEVAMQELKILEAQHPTRFQFLKLQLKEFIHDLDQDQHSLFQPKQQHSSSIITQESSSRKRDQKDEGSSKSKSKRIRRRRRKGGEGEGEGINGAIQRAEECLSKIQTFKSFLLNCSSSSTSTN